MKKLRRWADTVLIVALLLTLIGRVSVIETMAAEEETSIRGLVYTFDDKNDYDYTSSADY